MQTLIQYAIPILFSLSVFLFAFSLLPSRSPLSRQLEVLQTRNITLGEASRIAMFERMFSTERRAVLGKKLIEAGWYTVTPAKIGLRICAGACLGIVFAILIWRFIHMPTFLLLLLAVLVPVACTYSPIFFLNQAIEGRKIAIQKALPDFLDMVATTVQAGLSVNAAFAYAVDAAPGPLGDEIKEALSEIRLGRARADALRAAADRANQQEFKTAITAITQAEKLGSNVATVLNELAEDTRHHRVMVVEENAAKLPVKMVFPMAFFMLPSLFVIIFGTLIANYFATK
ncbi:MAG: type II secretion system F family protein [Vulcanimicrobiaceae bacterium]